jgi:drug/metabolite transporter (DMT)-like permease
MGQTFQRERLIAGALYVIGASLMFALMAACVKLVSHELPNTVIVFWRNGLALALMTPLLMRSTQRRELKTRHLRRHLVRAFAGLGSMYLFFLTIFYMPLTEAVLLSFTAPLFIPLVARIWIGEPITRRIRTGVWVGFVGILLILKPGTSIFQPIAFAGIGAGMLVAVAHVSIRRMSDTEPPARIVFYFCLLATLGSSAPLALTWSTPTGSQALVLFLIAAVALTGQLLVTRGFNVAPVSKVGVLLYFNVAFSALFGWLWWGEGLDALTLVGGLIIFAAGLITTSGRIPSPVPAPGTDRL